MHRPLTYILATWKGVEIAVKLLGANIVGDEANKEVTTAVPITKQLQNQFVDEATLMTTLRHPVCTIPLPPLVIAVIL